MTEEKTMKPIKSIHLIKSLFVVGGTRGCAALPSCHPVRAFSRRTNRRLLRRRDLPNQRKLPKR